jgi:hypothetical protein
MSAASSYAAAPKGSTGECKDGSYTSAETKRGACASHGGVKDWYKSEAKSERTVSAPKDATGRCDDGSYTSAQTRQGACASHGGIKEWYAKESPAAAGGSAGRVWVNTSTNVYHCSGDRWYGKTEQGEYMSESQAKSKGNRPDHGKACSER